jgi:hypothetical protein
MAMVDRMNDLLFNIMTTEMSEFIADELGIDANLVKNIIKKFLHQEPLKNKEKCLLNKKFTLVATVNNHCQVEINKGVYKGQICGAKIRKPGEIVCSKHKNRPVKSTKKSDP